MFALRYTFIFSVATLLSATTYNCVSYPAPGTFAAALTGINNAGIAVGLTGFDSNSGRGLKYDTVTGTAAIIQFPGAFDTELLSINNSGVAIGSFNFDYGLDKKGWFTLDSSGNFKTITAPPPYTLKQIFGINDAGALSAVLMDPSNHDVVAILNPDGSVTVLPDTLNPTVRSLHNSRQELVWSFDTHGSTLVDANTGVSTPILHPVPANDTRAFGLNNLGTVAGTIYGSVELGFTRDAGGVYSEILCGHPSGVQWYSINDNGVIVGRTGENSLAAVVSYIATPVPGQPQINLSSNSLNFPDTPVGQNSAPQTVTLTNSGNARLDIAIHSTNSEFRASGCVDPNTTTGSLEPGASCTLTVTAFAGGPGQRTGTLWIDDSAPGAPHFIPLSVNGTAPTCQITVGPRNANFTIQDANSGLSQILVLASTNANVNIPSFTQGTTSPITVTATQIDAAQFSRVSLRATNVAGAETFCSTAFGDIAVLTVTTSSLPRGTVGTPYSQTLTASGGTGGNTWSIISGSLPQGLALSPAGMISGTPSAASSPNFWVQVQDSSGATASKALVIFIDNQAPPPLTVTTSTLANGAVGTAYFQQLMASGGVFPYTWSITSGALPQGLTLSATGRISGTPTASGQNFFTVQVTDSSSATASKALSISINAQSPPPLTITTSSLPNGTTGTAYSQQLTASGGSGGNTWSITSGALPQGLALDAGGM